MYIGVDFDGTIVDHAYPDIGEPVPGAIETMKMFQEQGHQLILWTMRSGEELQAAVDYLEKNGINLFGINNNPTQKSWTDSPKVYCHVYIDDAALGAPLTHIRGFNRLCVNWEAVKNYFDSIATK
jgi:hydroxymethylpyrimidine pyrophosphatase-like HAD family hydrolase